MMKGELKVYVVVSDNHEYIDEWITTSSSHGVHIKGVNEFVPNETIYCAFIVTGYELNEKGKVDLSADMEVIKPDATILFSEVNYAKADKKTDNKPGFIMMDPALDLVLDKTDVLGVYTIKVTIRDKINSKIANAEEKIILSNTKRANDILNKPINDAKTLDDLWMYYFEKKDAEAVKRIISVVHWVEDGKGFEIVLGGAARWSLKSNAYQHPDIYNICKEQVNQSRGLTKEILEKVIREIDERKLQKL